MNPATLSKEHLARKIETLLSGKDAVVVEAASLTDFPWTSLCFERDDQLLLRIDQSGSQSVLSLPYEEFFVDEAHVPHSLEDECVAPHDAILIKRKYPGYRGPVEFQKAPSGG
ncbi:MAG: hypothetical protein ACOH1V_04885 [Stenotrophomonas sp.]